MVASAKNVGEFVIKNMIGTAANARDAAKRRQRVIIIYTKKDGSLYLAKGNSGVKENVRYVEILSISNMIINPLIKHANLNAPDVDIQLRIMIFSRFQADAKRSAIIVGKSGIIKRSLWMNLRLLLIVGLP